jgi:hypothetical protein
MRKLAVLAAFSVVVVLVPSGSATAAATCFAPDHTFAERLMHGHLDGDGDLDAVWVGATRPDESCRYFVYARTASGLSWVRLPAPDRFSRFSLRHFARPIALVRVDQVPGKEIAVKLLEGASVRPFGFFTIRFGAIRRMAIDETAPQPLAAEDMFAFGGGLSLMFGTDCAYGRAPRTVIFSRAFPRANGPRYVVERRWFQVRGASFARTSIPMERAVVRLENLRNRFPEFRHDGLLPRCDGVVLDPRHA